MPLKLAHDELGLLATRIESDYMMAKAAHQSRIERFKRYYRLWRNMQEPDLPEDDGRPNFSTPLLQWNLFAKMGSVVQGLFGDDAQIKSKPVGPADQRNSAKINCWMNWRVFQSMSLVIPASVHIFRMLLFGRSIVYMPWVVERFTTLDEQGKEVEKTWYEGPGFFPQLPDDVIVPAEDAESIHDFSWVMRKYRETPDELLSGEEQGKYFGIKEDFENIVKQATGQPRRDPLGDDILREQDADEGVLYQGLTGNRDVLLVYEWYGRWRLPKKGKQSAGDQTDLQSREMRETELVVRYIPTLKKVISVERLIDLYPTMKDRRPLEDASLVKDGSYWGMGFGQLLEDIQSEVSKVRNLTTEAGQFSVGPLIFYKPGSGFDPKSFRYAPNMAVPTDEPSTVNVVRLDSNMSWPLAHEQAMMSYGERVTGVTDSSMGRAQSQPNAPRTATGQMALLQKGDVRVEMDLTFLREDFKRALSRIWMLDCEFCEEQQFFRVTEEEANGLFDTKNGGAYMQPDEFGGRYDFSIQFATSVWSREADDAKTLQRYQLDLQNPLIVQNPKAIWKVTNDAHKALGDKNFADLVPMPPDLDEPRTPQDEWTRILQGEEVKTNPMDNDDLHLLSHFRQLRGEKERKEPDVSAMHGLIAHIIEHQDQKRQKMMMQALTQSLAQQAAQAANTVAAHANPLQQMMGQAAANQMNQQQPPQPPMENPLEQPQ